MDLGTFSDLLQLLWEIIGIAERIFVVNLVTKLLIVY
jgi:hypothetical protein